MALPRAKSLPENPKYPFYILQVAQFFCAPRAGRGVTCCHKMAYVDFDPLFVVVFLGVAWSQNDSFVELRQNVLAAGRTWRMGQWLRADRRPFAAWSKASERRTNARETNCSPGCSRSAISQRQSSPLSTCSTIPARHGPSGQRHLRCVYCPGARSKRRDIPRHVLWLGLPFLLGCRRSVWIARRRAGLCCWCRTQR